MAAVKTSIRCSIYNRIAILLSMALVAISVSACSSSGGGDEETFDASNFSLRSSPTNLQLIEGDSAGLDIPINLTRTDGHTADVILSIEGVKAQDSAFVSTAFSNASLTSTNSQTSVNLRLDVGVMPILPQQRNFRIVATDGNQTDELTITVNVQPTDSDDVYLLIGQSNMVGFGGIKIFAHRGSPRRSILCICRLMNLPLIRKKTILVLA